MFCWNIWIKEKEINKTNWNIRLYKVELFKIHYPIHLIVIFI